jgi:hypothetical protein
MRAAAAKLPEMVHLYTHGLAPLGYTVSRADDLIDCFAFNQTPLPYRGVQALCSKSYFVSHWRFEPPDNDWGPGLRVKVDKAG